MKLYIVYVDGIETGGMIKAANHNAAEKKAKKLYPGRNVSVEYTEV
jgi:ribosome-associated protein YbcJ (S4-like RNA binding protein)